MWIPCGKALWMLCSNTGSRTIRPTKNDGYIHRSGWHVKCFCGWIYNLRMQQNYYAVLCTLCTERCFKGTFGMVQNKTQFTWSMACMEKLNVINSQMGRRPAIAAPTAIPAKPISVIGVSMTRLSPYFFHSPLDTYFKHMEMKSVAKNKRTHMLHSIPKLCTVAFRRTIVASDHDW